MRPLDKAGFQQQNYVPHIDTTTDNAFSPAMNKVGLLRK